MWNGRDRLKTTWRLTPGAPLAAWVIAGAALLLGLGIAPVQRTQEARVLETAREMLGGGARQWMIPSLNGRVRVRKPPLAYWLSAGAYEIGGISEGVGRVPDALIGWLTVGLTFACGCRLFSRRAGLLAAACLLCSYLFFRFVRLAETDTPAMFFVTLGVFAFWLAIGRDTGDVPEHSALWFHLGAAATALAILSKGPPGSFPPLFLLAMSAWRRSWTPIRRFLRSGAWITLAILALPWFLYILHAVGLEQWKRESDELFGGEDHRGRFYQYFVELFKATAPWCLVMPAALWAAWVRRRDDRVGGMLIWLAVIFVPLCFVSNKQFHYLLPLMPPMMIVIGRHLDLALESTGAVPSLDLTFLLAALGIPGVLIAGRLIEGRIRWPEWALAGGIALSLALVAAAWLHSGRSAGLAVFLGAAVILFVPAVGIWIPSIEAGDSRLVADELRTRFGAGPYCFYGPNLSLPLCFNLRTRIPEERTAAELQALSADLPGLVVIAQTKSHAVPPPLPPGFVERTPPITAPGQVYRIYQGAR